MIGDNLARLGDSSNSYTNLLNLGKNAKGQSLFKSDPTYEQ